ASAYYHRDLQSSFKQRLTHFLCANGVGKQGTPGENIIITCKSNFYCQEVTDACNPLHVLSSELRQIGHIRLAAMVDDGSWERMEEWPIVKNQENIFNAVRKRAGLPWDWSPEQDIWP